MMGVRLMAELARGLCVVTGHIGCTGLCILADRHIPVERIWKEAVEGAVVGHSLADIRLQATVLCLQRDCFFLRINST